jgi:DNA-binding response OmpR family regulator
MENTAKDLSHNNVQENPDATVVFVLEDDADLQNILTYNLQRGGYKVKCFERAEEMIRHIDSSQTMPLHAAVVDINLAGQMNGIEAVEYLRSRKQTARVPVIMLTAKGENSDIVKGLHSGADDYLPKPFDMEVFMARLGSCVRRSEKSQALVRSSKRKVAIAGIDLDPVVHKANIGPEDLNLTVTEFGLLYSLMLRPEEVIGREDLVLRLMGPNKNVTLRTIDVHVRALRSKMGKKAKHVFTVRGVGYKFVP